MNGDILHTVDQKPQVTRIICHRDIIQPVDVCRKTQGSASHRLDVRTKIDHHSVSQQTEQITMDGISCRLQGVNEDQQDDHVPQNQNMPVPMASSTNVGQQGGTSPIPVKAAVIRKLATNSPLYGCIYSKARFSSFRLSKQRGHTD